MSADAADSDRNEPTSPSPRAHLPGDATDDLLARLRRIEGQVRGIHRMVEAGRPCEDVLTQVSAVTNALRRVGVMMMGCAVTRAVQHALGEGRDATAEVERLAAALAKLG